MEFKDYVIMLAMIIGAIIAGVVTTMQYYDSTIKDKKNEEMSQALIKAQESSQLKSDQIIKEQMTSQSKSDQLLELQQISQIKSDELILAQKKINELNERIINEINGQGYTTLNMLKDGQDSFILFLTKSSDYSVMNIFTTILDTEKLKNCATLLPNGTVNVKYNCYKSATLVSTMDDFRAGEFFIFNAKLPYKNYYLTTLMVNRNSSIIQYTIMEFDETQNKINYSFRLFEFHKGNPASFQLLFDSDPSIEDKKYEQHFFYKKDIVNSMF